MRLISNLFLGASAAVLLVGCKASGDYQGLEYAPNMYHSVAYEPLTQVTDKEAGWYFNSLDAREGEFYNSNQYNPHAMNLRLPAPHTVKRNANGWLPYRGANDSTGLRLANRLVNPYSSSPALLDQGKVLF